MKRKIFYKILFCHYKIKIIFQYLFYHQKVYLLGSAIHGNLGDQAIFNTEKLFIKNVLNYKVINMEVAFVTNNINFIKKIIKNHPIFIQGGGFLGSLWQYEENMFRLVVKNFPNNTIIVMPQTVYFEKKDFFIEESKQIYSSNPNVTFFCREEYSFNFMKKNFKKCNIELVPDIVLYNSPIDDKKNIRNNVLFCIRSDKEKVNHSYEKINKLCVEKKLKVDYTDTVIKGKVFEFNRKNKLNKKLKQFSKYKIVVTDRLHGMVFAFLTKTPCIVYENSSYKVKGLFKWLENCNCNYIKLYNEENIERDFIELLNIRNKNADFNKLIKQFNPLIKKVKGEKYD